MAINTFFLNGFNDKTQYVRYFQDIKDDTYIFTVRWSDYCDCAFLSISDYYDNPIISGLALVNNLVIRNEQIPYPIYFIHTNGETYEPTLDNIATEFMLIYDDEVEN